MAKKISRRRFLELGSLGTVAALAGCVQPIPAPAPAAPAAPAPAAPAAPAVPTTAPVAAPAAAKAGAVLNYAEAGDFNHFGPWSMQATNMGMYNQVFDRLIWKDGSAKEHMQMATGWEMAKDGLSATVKMREDVKWHDGKAHVAQDYVDMFNYTKDDVLVKDLGVSKTKSLLAPVKEVQAADKYTVKFIFNSPVPYFTELLDYLWAVRIDSKEDAGFLKKPPVATGPFKMVEWVPNQYARFVRFADYYVKGQPILDEIMFRRLEKTETLIPNLQSGTVAGIQVTNPADVDMLKTDKNLRVEINSNAGSHFLIAVNVLKPPFDKKEVRQALSFSLNREEMAKKAFFGVSQPIQSAFFSPSTMAYREDLLKAYPFDLDKAAKLLETAGVKNLEFTFPTYPRYPQFKLYGLIWQADLAKIGVKVNVTEIEQAKFSTDTAKKDMAGYDMYPHIVGRTTRDPAIFISTQAPYKAGKDAKHGWQNAEYEKLTADAAQELDPAKRKQMYQRCNEILSQELPMIPVATDPRIWAWNAKVTGIDVDLVGNITLANTKLA